MFNVISIKAPRPAVDWYSTSQAAERPRDDASAPIDRISISPEARSQLAQAAAGGAVFGASAPAAPESQDGGSPESGGGQAKAKDQGKAPGGAAPSPAGKQLTPEQRQQVQELQARDVHVRSHEAAHQAAGGDLTGAATFTYELGPDGRSYAVGGEVPIQSRTGRTPDETIAIARRVRAAALAPSDPSAADLAAAASASQVELRAAQQKRQAQQPGAAGQAPGAGRAAAPSQPTSTPRADLERVIVRAPEASNPF